MTGFWLLSYFALWVLVILLGLVSLGMMRELGVVRRSRASTASEFLSARPLDAVGPKLGQSLPDLGVRIVGDTTIRPLNAIAGEMKLLLMFMSPMCRGCQEIVEELNSLASDRSTELRILVVLGGDEVTSGSFIKLFPLQASVVLDVHSEISEFFNVHYNPYGLFYSQTGILVAKSVIPDQEGLATLVREGSERSAAA